MQIPPFLGSAYLGYDFGLLHPQYYTCIQPKTVTPPLATDAGGINRTVLVAEHALLT